MSFFQGDPDDAPESLDEDVECGYCGDDACGICGGCEQCGDCHCYEDEESDDDE